MPHERQVLQIRQHHHKRNDPAHTARPSNSIQHQAFQVHFRHSKANTHCGQRSDGPNGDLCCSCHGYAVGEEERGLEGRGLEGRGLEGRGLLKQDALQNDERSRDPKNLRSRITRTNIHKGTMRIAQRTSVLHRPIQLLTSPKGR